MIRLALQNSHSEVLGSNISQIRDLSLMQLDRDGAEKGRCGWGWEGVSGEY